MIDITEILRLILARLQKRSLVGSDAIIVAAILCHVGEAITLLVTRKADWPIGLGTLLAIGALVGGDRRFVSAVMFMSAIAASVGQWRSGISPFRRWLFLAPQQTLLIMTALGSVYAAAVGYYPDYSLHLSEHVTRPGIGITWDQYFRIAAPFLYAVAMWARIKAI